MNNPKKGNNSIVQLAVPTVLLVIVIVFTLCSYWANMLQNETNNKLEEYENKAVQMANYYSSEVYMIGQVARMLSTRVSAEFDYFCDDNVDLLSSAVKQLNLDCAYIIKNDGTVMSDKGVEYETISDATNGDVISYENDVNSQYVVTKSGDSIHYVSASFAEGAVILKCSPEEISNLDIYMSSNSKICTFMLVSSKGVILDSAGADAKSLKVGSIVFDNLNNATYENANKESMFKGNLEQQSKGKTRVITESGVAKYFLYQPIGEYNTSVMIAIDDVEISRASKSGIKKTTDMVISIIIYMVVFISILLVMSIFNTTKYRKVNRELKEQAETDLLTDLYNKVATETKIKEYLEGEGKNKKSLMFVLDIDNFKKINDTMGHAFGDEVLNTLGHQLKSEFRINDIIGRTGGDEFIIFLKDLKDDTVLRKEAERVATFFKNFKVGEYTKYSATASIGAVEIPQDGTDFDSLYKAADKALYKAKKRGKNQMAFYKDTKNDIDEPVEPILKVVSEDEPIINKDDNINDRELLERKVAELENVDISLASIDKEIEKDLFKDIENSNEKDASLNEDNIKDEPDENMAEVEEAIEDKAIEEASVEVKKEEVALDTTLTEEVKETVAEEANKTEDKPVTPVKKKVVKKVVKKVPKKKADGTEVLAENKETSKGEIISETVVSAEPVLDEFGNAVKKKVVKKIVKKKVVKKVPKQADSSLNEVDEKSVSMDDKPGEKEIIPEPSDEVKTVDETPDITSTTSNSMFSIMMDKK